MPAARFSRLFVIFLQFLACSTVFAADAPWKIGVASIKITPPKPVVMAGYAGRTKPFDGVEQDIYAKALLLDDGAGSRALLITLDLVGIRPPVAEPVCQRITEKTGLQRPQILLNCSHSHAGPSLSHDPEPDVQPAAGAAHDTLEYTRWLQDRLVELAVQAAANPRPARLSWGVGVATFVMNRREFTTDRGIILGVDPRGPVDRAVPVLRVENPADQKPFVVVFGCADHNTTLGPQNLKICGDYAGFAQHDLQDQFPGTTALFVQGFGGDANPYPRGTMEIARDHGKELAAEVARVVQDTKKLKPVAGPIKTLLEYVDLPLRPASRDELVKLAAKSPNWQIGSARAMLAMLDRGESLPTSYRAPIALWQFGHDLTFVGVSGEVVVDYAHLIEAQIGHLQLWPAGYCNDVFGYLPSARVLKEGGYETRGLNTGTGWFSPQAQDVVVNKVKDLAQKAGRTSADP